MRYYILKRDFSKSHANEQFSLVISNSIIAAKKKADDLSDTNSQVWILTETEGECLSELLNIF